MPHSYDFMEYAYLQLGEDIKARRLVQDTAAIKKTVGPLLPTARAAVPARYVLERQDWKAAAQLQPLGTGIPTVEAITHFARALGAARSDDVAAAEMDIDKLNELRAQLEEANQPYWAGQTEIQILAAQAWVHQAQGNKGGGAEVHARGG